MKRNRTIVSLLILCITVFICFISLSSVASAFTNEKGSITLTITDTQTGEPITNRTYRLYYIASAVETESGVAYTYVSPYDESNMELGNLQDAYLPLHLAAFATERNLPFIENASDTNGQLIFTELDPGVYLLVSPDNTNSDYKSSPFLVCIPLYDKTNNNWLFDVDATPKLENSGPTDETTYLTVKKKWDSFSNNIPQSVTVSLLRDYVVVDSVVLNADNHWSYRWDNLSKDYAWSVVETSVPNGYFVIYDTTSNTVIITNKEKRPPSPPPSYPEEEPPTPPDELIETGQLNWPVPVLATGGLLLFALGWAMTNFGKKQYD